MNTMAIGNKFCIGSTSIADVGTFVAGRTQGLSYALDVYARNSHINKNFNCFVHNYLNPAALQKLMTTVAAESDVQTRRKSRHSGQCRDEFQWIEKNTISYGIGSRTRDTARSPSRSGAGKWRAEYPSGARSITDSHSPRL